MTLQAVILAGGLGTRMRPITEKMPKAMIPIRGKPFLERQLELLKENGVTNFVLCVGYLGEAIRRYFEDGTKFGLRIRYSFDGDKLLGPAGALKKAESLLGETFFVTYGDAYLVIDYKELMHHLLDSGKLAVMAVYKNSNMYGRSDVVVKDGCVVRYYKRTQTPDTQWINFGVSALYRQALRLVPPDRECSEEEFYGELINRKELLAYEVENRFYEIGTPKSLEEFEKFLGDSVWKEK